MQPAYDIHPGAAGAMPMALQRMQVDAVAMQQQLDMQREFNTRMREALSTRDHDLIRAREREEEATLRAERAERAASEARERVARAEAARAELAAAPPSQSPAPAAPPASEISRADFEVLQDGIRRLRDEMSMIRTTPQIEAPPPPQPQPPPLPSARELEIMQLRSRLEQLEHEPVSSPSAAMPPTTPVPPHPFAVDTEGVQVIPAPHSSPPTSAARTFTERPHATPDTWGLQRRVEQLEHDVRAKDNQLAAYEESLADAMFHRTFAATAAPPPPPSAPAASAAAMRSSGGSALGQLRTLMGEAYLLKLALQRQGAAPPHVIKTLDSWIMASHALKKAVTK